MYAHLTLPLLTTVVPSYQTDVQILRKYGRTAVSQGLIAELSSYDTTLSALPPPSHTRRSRSRNHPHQHSRSRSADSSSSSSSGASFHSSQASPPRSPTPPPARSHTESRSSVAYPLPDPDMPIPDIAPDIVPPSALNASHKSLLSLANAVSAADAVEASQQHLASRAHSLLEGRHGTGMQSHLAREGGTAQSRGSPSIRSLRSAAGRSVGQVASTSASALGFAPLHPAHQHLPPPQAYSHPAAPPSGQYRQHLTPDPNLIARDFTPVLAPDASPYITYRGPYDPNRPGTPSTFTVPPINVPATLQQISTSLTALHERLATLERTQGLILRREQRKRGTWLGAIFGLGLGGLLGGKTEEEDLDEAEEAAERERRQARDNDARAGQLNAGRAEVPVASVFSPSPEGRRRGNRSRLALVWWLLRVIRRIVVDVAMGVTLAVAIILIMRGWRMRYVRRLRSKVKKLISDVSA